MKAKLLLAVMLLASAAAVAQSGRGSMRGYVSLDDQAPIEPTRAHATLDGTQPGEKAHYAADTSERGLFEISPVLMGEYRLAISAPGYKTYETTLYIPSDFLGNLAVILKRDGTRKARPAKGDSP